jgi:hypothetical protein
LSDKVYSHASSNTIVSGTTSVPRPEFGPRGFVPPNELDVLEGVIADFQAAFGGRLNFTNLETPQGQIASTMTAIIADKDAQFVALANGVDPAYATGRMQDGIGRIYFINRFTGQPTTVMARCIGRVGALIPAGSLARSADGTIFRSTEPGTIGADGTIDISFQAEIVGPLHVPAGALNTIFSTIAGWDLITNPSAGITGRNTESRYDFEERRFRSVQRNSRSSIAAVLGEVLTVPGVLDAYATENDTNVAVVIDDITLPPHSLYLCAAGGDPHEIALAIWRKKTIGCDMAGNHDEVVFDEAPYWSDPAPSYRITFQIPEPMPFYVLVTIRQNMGIPADYMELIRDTVLAVFEGNQQTRMPEEVPTRARIGGIVLASRFVCPVTDLGGWAQVIDVKIGTASQPFARFHASFRPGVMEVHSIEDDGHLEAGLFITGPGVPPGIRIIARGTAYDWQTGIYVISTFDPAIPDIDCIAIRAGLDHASVGITHIPVLSREDIGVNIFTGVPPPSMEGILQRALPG